MSKQVLGAAGFKTSIVVLTYNGCDALTRPCVESLLKHSEFGSYELVLVDNASSDSTPQYLKQLASQHSSVRLCLNNKNKGYAAGNNDGLRLVTGQYVVLLNNDTLVGPDWMGAMLERLESSPEIGLVGPVTNSAGNEQCVDIKGLNEQNFIEVAGQYTQLQGGRWFETEKLGFFCVAGRREVFEQVGLLDEDFGLGMFEDDDYCIRVRQAGYKLVVVEDSFVYHKGSMSFKKLPSADYLQLFEKNRAYFFKKHQLVWTYSDIATAIWRCIRSNLSDGSPAAWQSILARLRLMDDALYQVRHREENTMFINGVSAADHKLAEKHRQLMEMSDWASKLNEANQKLSGILSENQDELIKISDLVTTLQTRNVALSSQLDAIRSAFFYRVLRCLKLIPL